MPQLLLRTNGNCWHELRVRKETLGRGGSEMVEQAR